MALIGVGERVHIEYILIGHLKLIPFTREQLLSPPLMQIFSLGHGVDVADKG